MSLISKENTMSDLELPGKSFLMEMISNAIYQWEEGIHNEFTLGIYFGRALVVCDMAPYQEVSQHLSQVHNYFASEPVFRKKLSTGLHDHGFTEAERDEVRKAWTALGGTCDLFKEI